MIAAVESVEMKGATKSLAETRTTATDVLGGGMTMLADAGVSATVEAAAAANANAQVEAAPMATPSPSLKGASAMLELGYRFTPKKSRVSYDVNLSGWQGKREGFSGSVGVNWAF